MQLQLIKVPGCILSLSCSPSPQLSLPLPVNSSPLCLWAATMGGMESGSRDLQTITISSRLKNQSMLCLSVCLSVCLLDHLRSISVLWTELNHAHSIFSQHKHPFICGVNGDHMPKYLNIKKTLNSMQSSSHFMHKTYYA